MFQPLSKKPLLCLLLLLPLLYFPIFGHLDELTLDCWDEARLAVNAQEMYHSGNWIVTTFQYSPDMWNTKPPLMIWLQVLCIRMLGESELAIRLPSAMAALATCLLLFWFFFRKYGNAVLGMLTCIVLITSEGYVRRHGIRTGDYDSLLTFFTTAFVLFWFLYIEEVKTKYFYFFISALILSCLTKGVQPLIFLPAILVYTLYRRKVFFVIKTPHFYVGALMFLLFIPGYYLLREHYNPGYINAVFENELGGRFGTVIEEHHGSFWFYHNILLKQDFNVWYILTPIGMILGLCADDVFIKRLSLYTGTVAFLYLLLLSSAATKIHWYDTPALPFLSILVALGLYRIFTMIQPPQGKYAVVYTLIAVSIFFIPYRQVFNKTMMGGEQAIGYPDNIKTAELFQRASKGKEDIKGYYVAHGHLEQNLVWYTELLMHQHIIKTHLAEHLDSGYKVIAFQEGIHKYIQGNYKFDVLGSDENIKRYLITGRKTADTSETKL